MEEVYICPCCKSKAIANRVGNPLFSVRCSNVKCGLEVSKPTLEEAISTWNYRKPIDDILEILLNEAEKYTKQSIDAEYDGRLSEKDRCNVKANSYLASYKIVKREGKGLC